MSSVAQGRSSVWWASCRHVDLELCAGAAMYMPGPRHQICFFPSLRLSLFRAASILGARSRLTTSHIVKYDWSVHIVTRKHLSEAMQEYPDAANEIKAWVAIVEGVRWHSFAEVRLMFAEVRLMFRDADYINGYVVFNIRRNRYRLITVIHYAKTTDEKRTEGHAYIRSFLTHKEYDDPRKWDRRFGAK
jgi:mRNA interferase HigB